jgi:hypothetical protein
VEKFQRVFKRIRFVRFFELSDPSEAKKSRKFCSARSLQNFAEFSHGLGGERPSAEWAGQRTDKGR